MGRVLASGMDQPNVLPLTCRLLPFAEADGPTNMATDETLLESAVMGAASLRFYGWSPPTVSLGYFQSHARRLDDPRTAGLPFVRRASGGDALVHHHELTYALAIPAGPPWQPHSGCTLCMHAILRAALTRFGVHCAIAQGAGVPRFAGLLCFQHLAPGDLLLDGHKIVGSAQRKQRGAILQHGGILLARSDYAPALPGIADLAAVSLDPQILAEAVRDEFVRATACTLQDDDWTPRERQRIAELVATKYRTDAWNRRR
jgi:lipoate-protein ligase A